MNKCIALRRLLNLCIVNWLRYDVFNSLLFKKHNVYKANYEDRVSRGFDLRFRFGPLVLVVLLLLSGCSKNESDRAIQIARDPSWFPIDFGGQETSVLAFSDELTEAIGRTQDFDVSFLSVTWEQIAVVLNSGRAEGVLSALPPIPEYRSVYDFSEVYLYIGPVLVVPYGSEATSLDDMKGKLIGVLGGSSGMLLVAKVSDIVVRDYMNVGVALEELERGKVDGVVMAALPAYAYMRDFYAGKLKIVTPPLTDAGLRLLVRKGHHGKLLEEFNRGLRTVRTDGTYNELQDKWRLNLQEGPQRAPFVTKFLD